MDTSTVIAVFCYKRKQKLKIAMEALLKNPECASMEVIFFSDGYKNDQDKQGVLETREYIDSITNFKSVRKEFREKNLSTGPNFELGLTYLCNNYDQFIVVEDDVVVTSNYIKYLLDALLYYKEQKSVFCITGFCFPLNKGLYEYDSLVYNRFSSNGWASWSDRVKGVVWNKYELSKLMETSPGFKKRLNKEGHDLYRMLKKQIVGKISTWDIQMQVHVAENQLNVIYPVVSKTNNIGFDNESTNTFGINFLKTPQDDGNKREFNFCDSQTISLSLQEQLRRPYRFWILVRRKIINTMIKHLILRR